MAINDRVYKFLNKAQREERKRTKALTRRVTIQNAPLTKEAEKTILSAKNKDDENEVANFN